MRNRKRRGSVDSFEQLNPCGSEPARESDLSVDIDVDWNDAFSSKPAPTVLCRAVEELLGVVASYLAVVEQAQGRLFSAATLGGVRAALVEGAARWRVQRVGQLADDLDFRLVRIRLTRAEGKRGAMPTQ